MTLQINTMMCGALASPGVRYSRVQLAGARKTHSETNQQGRPNTFSHMTWVSEMVSEENPWAPSESNTSSLERCHNMTVNADVRDSQRNFSCGQADWENMGFGNDHSSELQPL